MYAWLLFKADQITTGVTWDESDNQKEVGEKCLGVYKVDDPHLFLHDALFQFFIEQGRGLRSMMVTLYYAFGYQSCSGVK